MTEQESAQVFVVDDDIVAAERILRLCRSVGLSGRAFNSARNFLQALNEDMPACVVLDLRMPEMSGIELQRAIIEQQKMVPVIMVTEHGDVPSCRDAFRRGAFDYIEKSLGDNALLDSIQQAVRSRRAAAPTPFSSRELDALTPREMDVLHLLLDGKSQAEISTELGISVQTCSKHRAKIFQKLDVTNDVLLVRRLLSNEPSTPMRSSSLH